MGRTIVLLIGLSAAAFGQNTNPGHGPLHWMLEIPDWLDRLKHLGDPPPPLNYTPGEVRWEWKCENKKLVLYGYYKTYPGVNGFDPSVGRTPTNIPCEDEAKSTPKGDAPAANPNAAAQPRNQLQNAPQGSLPPPPRTGGGTARTPPSPSTTTQRTALAAGTLDLTLPYRELGIVPFSPVRKVNPPVTCAAGQNATGFILDYLQDTLTRHDLCTSQVIARIDVPWGLQVRVTPDGSQVLATSEINGVYFIDTATNKVTKVVDPGIVPSGLAISADGSYALVTNYDDASPSMVVLDIASKLVTATIPLGHTFPQSVFLNPDNTLAWVTYPWSDVVDVLDVMTGTVTKSLSIPNPFDVAFNPTGTEAYVASGAGSVKILQTSNYIMTSSVPAGAGACDLQVSPDGHLVTVNNYLANSTTIFDPRSAPFSVTIPAMGMQRGTLIVPVQ